MRNEIRKLFQTPTSPSHPFPYPPLNNEDENLQYYTKPRAEEDEPETKSVCDEMLV